MALTDTPFAAYQSVCSQLQDLKIRLRRSDNARLLGWPLFLDRLLIRFEVWGDHLFCDGAQLPGLTDQERDHIAETLQELQEYLGRCEEIADRGIEEEAGSLSLQLTLHQYIKTLGVTSEPRERKASSPSPTEDATYADHVEYEDELNAPSTRVTSRRSSYVEEPHDTIGTSIAKVFDDARMKRDRHAERLKKFLPPGQSLTYDDLEALLEQKFQKWATYTGQAGSFCTTVSLLIERLTYLSEAVSSLLQIGGHRTVAGADLLWRIFHGLVAIVPSGRFALLRQTWGCLENLARAMPRSNNYSFECLRVDALITEDDVAAVYAEALNYGFDMSFRIFDLLEQLPSWEPGDFELTAPGSTIANGTQYKMKTFRDISDAVDVKAWRYYMQRHATTPAILRRFNEMQRPISINKKDDAAFFDTAGTDLDDPQREDQILLLSKPTASDRYRIFDAPYRLLTLDFRGRAAAMSGLASQLADSQNGATTFISLHGIEGVGKTQIVLHYASGLWEVFPHHHVFWLCAVSPDQLMRGLEALLMILNADVSTLQDPESRAHAVRTTLQALTDSGQRWTLIVDDVRMNHTVSEMLARSIPVDADGGQVVFTTRHAESISRFDKHGLTNIEVGRLDKEDAVKVLLSAAGMSDGLEADQERVALQIVELLHCFPLAVRQAGVFMKWSTAYASLEKLYDLLLTDPLQISHQNIDSDDPSIAMAAPLLLSLREVRKQSPEVYQTLEVLAFLDPENIPFGSLVERLVQERGDDLSSPAALLQIHQADRQASRSRSRGRASSVNSYLSSARQSRHSSPDPQNEPILSVLSRAGGQRKVISEMLGTSLIHQRSSSPFLRLRLHESVQKLILEGMTKEVKQDMFSQAVTMIVNLIRPLLDDLDKERTWSQCDLLAPHLQALVEKCKDYNLDGSLLFPAYSKFGWYFYARGRYEEAVNCYKDSIPRLVGIEMSRTRERLARVYLRQSNFTKAQRELEFILDITQHGTPILTPQNLGMADLLARCYYSQGWFALAESLYERVLTMRERNRRGVDYEKANTFEGLANIHQRRGRDRQAEELYQKVLILRKQELGSKYLSLQRARYNQARLYRDQGRTREAITIFKSVLIEYEDVLGQWHPDTLRVACRLAFTYAQAGKLDKAEALAKKALEALKDDVSQHFAAIGLSRLVLASVATQLQDHEEAQRLLMEVLAVYDDRLGPEHPVTLHVRREYSFVCQRAGDYAKAIDVLEQIPPSHREGTAVNAKLARLYDWRSQEENSSDDAHRAQELAERTYLLQRKRQGSRSTDTNYSLWVLARIYRHQNDFAKACDHYDKALQGWDRIPNAMFGGAYDDLLKEYVEVLERIGDYGEAAKQRKLIGTGTQPSYYNIDPEPPMSSEDDGCWADADPNRSIESDVMDERLHTADLSIVTRRAPAVDIVSPTAVSTAAATTRDITRAPSPDMEDEVDASPIEPFPAWVEDLPAALKRKLTAVARAEMAEHQRMAQDSPRPRRL